MSLVSFFDKLNKIPLYLLLFLIPIFFLPFTQNVLDYPKNFLFLILILLSLIGWLGKGIFEGKLLLRENKIFYLSLFLIFLSLLFSSVFSLWPQISFFGYPLNIKDNFFTFLLFLILVFLIINSFQTKTEFLLLLLPLLFSAGISGIINLLQIYKIFLFPFDFTKFPSFNTIGTPASFALFATILLPISLILTFKFKNYLKIVLGAISFLLFLNILLINFKTAWLSLLVAILVLFIFSSGKKIRINWISLLMAGLIFSIFFYFFPISLPGFPVLPPEVSLGFNSEIYILKGSFSEVKNIILGTGPGTFIFDYSKYRPLLLNQTIFWGTRFSDGNSFFLDWILTKGILAGIILLFFYFLIIYFLVRYLGKSENKDFEIKLGLSASLSSLIFASFLYPFNFSLYFILFFLAGGFIFFFSPKLKEINLSSPSKVILLNSILMVVIIFSLCFFFLQSQRYFAEMSYLKGIKNSEVGNIDQAINYLEKARRLNPSLDIYWRDLSQLYLARANSISRDPNLAPEDKRKLTSQAIVNGAEAINQAINLAPINVANWNVRGFFYRNLIGIEKAEEISLDSYQKAIQLEPASPFAYGEKGRVYILLAQNFAQKGEDEISQKNLDLAIENLKKAIELKPDYAPAHYLLAVAFNQKGKIDEAISKLEEAKILAPQDIGVAFQLGLLYWRKEEIEKAQAEFERVLNLAPNYSNARYMLGLVYDKKGEKEKAIEEFKKISELNPENEEVKKILENVKKGLPALEGIISKQPPLPEAPPEIQPR
jgi:tetratricopeptide (TPR) repeat protein